TLSEANSYRVAAGKKQADLMSQIKELFLKKSKEKGLINEEQASILMDWLAAAQRYSFNFSHGIGYALNSIIYSLNLKAHFPVEFFTANLTFSSEKIDPKKEISELVNEAKLFDIIVKGPSILSLEEHFHIGADNSIYFGLVDIKNIGSSVFNKIKDILVDQDLKTIPYFSFLIRFCDKLNKTAVENLIKSGAMDHFGVSRLKMLYEFGKWEILLKNDKETAFCKNWELNQDQKNLKNNSNNFEKMLTDLLNSVIIRSKTRRKTVESVLAAIKNPPFSLIDDKNICAMQEAELLGVSITCSKLDKVDSSAANCTLKDFLEGFASKNICIACQIKSIKTVTCKKGNSKGKEMCFVPAVDTTGALDDIVIFSEAFEKYQNLLKENNLVMVNGYKDKNKGSLIINSLSQLEEV
ncbi:MAG: hypothetical protein AABY22_15525, partial [Nanoarchaeota archaeon]